jgi:hypothetical protein
MIKPVGEPFVREFYGTEMLCREFEITEGGVIEVDFAVTFQGIADLLGYKSHKQVSNLINRYKSDFAEDLWNPNDYAGPRFEDPHKIRPRGDQAIWVLGEGLDTFLMLSGKKAAREYRQVFKKYSRQLRLYGRASTTDQHPALASDLNSETNKLLRQLLIQQSKTNEHLVRAARALPSPADVEPPPQSAAPRPSPDWEYIQSGECYPKTAAAKLGAYSNSGKPHSKYIGALLRHHNYIARGLARHGKYWDRDQLRDRDCIIITAHGFDALYYLLENEKRQPANKPIIVNGRRFAVEFRIVR